MKFAFSPQLSKVLSSHGIQQNKGKKKLESRRSRMPPIITGSYIMQHRTESTFILHSGCEFRAVFTIFLPACTASWNGIFFFFPLLTTF